MKTTTIKSIKTKIILAIAVIFLSTAAVPAITLAANRRSIETVNLMPFRKIVVKGNVEVILVQQNDIGINYASDNVGDAKVTQHGDQLNIMAKGSERTKILVYVNDIYRIQAEDDAMVNTVGKLKLEFLQIILHDNASAAIDSETSSLYTVVADNAQLVLGGATENHFLNKSDSSKVTFSKFAALKTSLNPLESEVVVKGIAVNNKTIPQSIVSNNNNSASLKNDLLQ